MESSKWSPSLIWASMCVLAAGSAMFFGAGVLLGGTRAPQASSLPGPTPTDIVRARCTPLAGNTAEVARWSMLCLDYETGRIDRAAYLEARHKLMTPPQPPAPPSFTWASVVESFSSQYGSDDWSAAQVLGPPNVFPASGDNVHAWAPLVADGQTEILTVGFGAGTRASGIEIYETYNPGAITRVELIGADGTVREVTPIVPAGGRGGANRLVLTLPCTDTLVTGARLTLNTSHVSGWNEIDAIGLRGCDGGQ